MIPVAPQPEPDDFDAQVRQPGLRWLTENQGADFVYLSSSLAQVSPRAAHHLRWYLCLCLHLYRAGHGVTERGSLYRQVTTARADLRVEQLSARLRTDELAKTRV